MLWSAFPWRGANGRGRGDEGRDLERFEGSDSASIAVLAGWLRVLTEVDTELGFQPGRQEECKPPLSIDCIA